MPVAIEPRRLGKHKIYMIFQEVRKKSAAEVQIHDVIDKNAHFHVQSTLCANAWTWGQEVESNYLKVRYQLSSWSTQFLRKAAFVFKVYQSVHSVCYACTDQDFHLYLRAFTSFSSFTF